MKLLLKIYLFCFVTQVYSYPHQDQVIVPGNQEIELSKDVDGPVEVVVAQIIQDEVVQPEDFVSAKSPPAAEHEVGPELPEASPPNSPVVNDPPKKPQKPGSKPQKPGSKPQKPAGKPQKPASKPQKPAGKPQKPAGKPQKPAGKPQKPAGKPQKPAGKPQKPAGKPQKPSGKPQKPERPQRPVGKPSRPTQLGGDVEDVTVQSSSEFTTTEYPIEEVEYDLVVTTYGPDVEQ